MNEFEKKGIKEKRKKMKEEEKEGGKERTEKRKKTERMLIREKEGKEGSKISQKIRTGKERRRI